MSLRKCDVQTFKIFLQQLHHSHKYTTYHYPLIHTILLHSYMASKSARRSWP